MLDPRRMPPASSINPQQASSSAHPDIRSSKRQRVAAMMETPARCGEATVDPSPPAPPTLVGPVEPAAKTLPMPQRTMRIRILTNLQLLFQKHHHRQQLQPPQSEAPRRERSQLQLLLVIGWTPSTALGHPVPIKSWSTTNLTTKHAHHGKQVDKECIAQLKAVVLVWQRLKNTQSKLITKNNATEPED